MRKVLVVEDEFSINDILRFSLEEEGFKAFGAYNCKEARLAIDKFKPDVVLLDVMLPDGDGFELCEEFTDKAFVIMVTARGESIDRIRGIEIGADDYISKPFEIKEIIARINALFRRAGMKNTKGLSIDFEKRKVIYNNNEIDLKKKEFDLLAFLHKNKNIVLSRDTLIERVWGMDYEGEDRTVDIHIRRLRAKLGDEKGSSIIETVFGVGYVMR
ncbi:MAG: response regulator transcription factor [Clostridium sp.]